MLLIMVILVANLPQVSLAQVLGHPDTKAQLMAALVEQYGEDTAAELFELMVSMGIIDNNGNRLEYNIDMGGKPYTLEEMREFINTQGIDLEQEVKVDDTVVSLEFIVRLLEFEAYIKFVEENFVHNTVVMTDEHIEMLASLEQQLTTEGISLMSGNPEPANNVVVGYSLSQISANSINITYTLTGGNAETSVTFARQYFLGVQGIGGAVTDNGPSTITLTGSSRQVTVTISLPAIDNTLWSGEVALAYIYLYDLRGGLFANGKSSQLVPIKAHSSFTHTAFTGANFLVNPQPSNNLNGWNVTNGRWHNGSYGGEIKGDARSVVTGWQDIQLTPDGARLAQNGELRLSANGTFWGQASSTMTATLWVGFYNTQPNASSSDRSGAIDHVQDYDKTYRVGAHNKVLSISGHTVPAATTHVRLWAQNDNSLTYGPSMRAFSLTLRDVVKPTVIAINSPAATFRAGDRVPIVVTFSEPIVQNSVLTLTLRDAMDKQYTATSAGSGLTHSQVTFLLDIPPQTPISLWPVSVSAGARDVSGNLSNAHTFASSIEALPSVFAYNELHSLTGLTLKKEDGTVLTGAYPASEAKGLLEIALFQSATQTIDGSTIGQRQNEWLISNTTPDSDGNFAVDKLYASYDNGVTRIPLYITDEVDMLTAEFELPESGGHRMVLYMEHGDGFAPIVEPGYNASFSVGAVVLVQENEMRISYPQSYPSGRDKILRLGDAEQVRLTYSYSGNATYQSANDFYWASSNETIASISPTGYVTPRAIGKVKFSLVATNGTEDEAIHVIKESAEFSVTVALDNPSLSVSKYIITKRGVSVPVLWSTNITFINENMEIKRDTIFTLELYEGNFASIEALVDQTPVYTVDDLYNVTTQTIPGEMLTRLSVGAEPAYTVLISTDNPFVEGEKVKAVGNIAVTSPPASVQIARPTSYYILDTAESYTVNWQSLNVNDTPGGCEFVFDVVRNRESIATSNDPNGSHTITFGKVTGRLKDVYTIAAKIKNIDDETYSYDSFVLHVYNADALKIWIDKTDSSTLTMDNSGRIAGMTSADIVALERKIFLTNELSINYGDYTYGLVTDQIEWESSDSRVASINYTQGGAYNNIENYDLSSYMPDTRFILAGLRDGTAVIDATHKLSRMNETLGVTVKTLKNKLYLFQVMPMVETELRYTNGDGVGKIVYSDAQGAIAIYEPTGIASDLKLTSVAGGSTYMGTIYNTALLSGENDGSKGQLYPINNFVLRKAAQVDINFKNPNGTPYTSTVTIRGGVYKNGYYCEGSEISDSVTAWENTITLGPINGHYRQNFDITRFWSAAAGETSESGISATDKIEYVFEFKFANDDHLPQIVTFSGNSSGVDVLRYGESVVKLVATEPNAKEKPFFAAQFLDRYKKSGRRDDIKNTTGNIGINAQIPKIRIDTQALWWGVPVNNTRVAIALQSEAGAAIPGQSHRTILYPFATMLATEHQVVIDNTNIWVNETGRGKVTVRLFNHDGSLYSSAVAPYSIRNMMNIANVTDSDDINSAFQEELKKNIKAGASFDASDKLVGSALKFASNIQFGNDTFSLMLAPTPDPTVFSGLLQLNIGDDVMDIGPAVDGFSLMLDDDEVDKIGGGKAGFAKTRELANDLKDELDSLKDEASDFSAKYQVGGYFSCHVYYNFDTGKWAIRPIGGGIRAGVSVEFSHVGTQLLGPVPVTYEIALGAAVRLEFDVHMLYEPVTVGGIEYLWQDDYASVTDYLTNLRIRAYIYAFGGLGFDLSVVALKIGVFGEITLENENKFLNRNYLAPAIANSSAGAGQTEKALSGSRLELKGQVGIKFVAKFLFIKYQKTLASLPFSKEWTYRNWDKIEAYWQETTSDMLTPDKVRMAAQMYAAATGQDYIILSQAPQLESRAYLNDYPRQWGIGRGMSLMSLDPINLAPSTLQSNAYPYANPLIADDGSLFVYLSDNNSTEVWDTTASYAQYIGGSYVDRGRIDPGTSSFGDSQLSFASANGVAVATWARLRDKIDKNQGDELTSAEMSMMINNSEIFASIYDGNTWTTTRITDNNTPDMAPVVATNGSKAVVAWRSLFAGDPDNPTDFSGKDNIVYRIYDGKGWGATKTLYNGISGNVVGLQASMLSDDTVAIAYIIDPSREKEATTYEVVYGVISADSGDAIRNVRLTNDDSSDENPQLTVATFGPEDERFMLGWYKLDGSKSDIRLATFGNDGSLREDFVDSLYAVSRGSNISGNFKFINTSSGQKDFKNLSILWTEYDQATGSDSLKAIKFKRETLNGIELTFSSAAIDVAQMPANTVIDSFDAYVSDAAHDEVKVIILGTETTSIFDTITDVDETGQTFEINVPRTQSKMFTATEVYQNKAAITSADYNFTEIMSGFPLPVIFTVQNQGKDLMTSVTINYGSKTKTFNEVILPGVSATFVVNHNVPEDITDLDYNGTATFGSDSVVLAGAGLLPLAITDLGISSITTTKEQDGLREFAVSLYNASDYKLENSSKTVRLAVYDSSAYVAGQELISLTISDSDSLALIDKGAYTTTLNFDLKAYLAAQGKNEIPANGVTLYAKAWVEDSERKQLPEFIGDNNFATIQCANLVKRHNGSPVKLDVLQSNSDSATTVLLTVQNLSMANITNGNVAVNLLDMGGNIHKTEYLSNS